MERLTKRCKQALNDKMTKFKKFIEIALSEPKYHEKGNFSTQSTYDIYETNKLYPMASKLADYEDAEEQGLLLRLPCKVGDTVWDNDYGKPCTYRITGFSFGTADNYIDEPLKETELIFYYENPSGSITGSFVVSEIGKTVFLTKEEAEKALADMGV